MKIKYVSLFFVLFTQANTMEITHQSKSQKVNIVDYVAGMFTASIKVSKKVVDIIKGTGPKLCNWYGNLVLDAINTHNERRQSDLDDPDEGIIIYLDEDEDNGNRSYSYELDEKGNKVNLLYDDELEVVDSELTTRQKILWGLLTLMQISASFLPQAKISTNCKLRKEYLENDNTNEVLAQHEAEWCSHLSDAKNKEGTCKQRIQAYEERLKLLSGKSIWGGVDWGMDPDQIKQVIKDKFNHMKSMGLIVSRDEYDMIKDQYFIRKDNRNGDLLTRVWGADYLREQITSDYSDYYGVPEYIIVLNNTNEICVSLWANSRDILVNELHNGSIFFKKIIGSIEGCGRDRYFLRGTLSFTDCSDPGNIMKEEHTGKKYIVDTEYKSFDIPSGNYDPNLIMYALEKFYSHNEFDSQICVKLD